MAAHFTRICYAVLVAFAGCFAHANEIAELSKGAPPVPPGFADMKEIEKALLSGKVKLIKPPSETPESITVTKDIEYGKGGETPLLLDIYVPKSITKPVPALVFIHGGGWEGGNKKDYVVYNIDYAVKGYVTVSINYRFAKEAKFPAAVEDCKCAIRWVRANAAKYGIDPEKICVIGGSAGGHLSLMVGYSDDLSLEGAGGNNDQSSRVQAVVNFYGVPDMTGDLAKDARETNNFIGKTQDEDFAAYAKASPVVHLDKSDPPTLSFHGTIDNLIPYRDTERLHANLDALGVPNAYEIIEGWPHTMDAAAEINAHCQFVIDRFLEKYLPLPK